MNGPGLLARLRSWAPSLLSTARILAPVLFIEPGTAKPFALFLPG
jgi:hypothetical protein